MYIPKSIISWLIANGWREKRKIYGDYCGKVYPPFDNTCSKEEYMEKLDKAIAEINEKENNNN